jgi:hypothetical protein
VFAGWSRREASLLVFVAVLMMPGAARASDMALLGPVFFSPVNVLTGVVTLLLGVGPRPTKLSAWSVLAGLAYLCVLLVASLMALVAVEYLFEGNYVGSAGGYVLSYLFVVAAGVYTRRPGRPLETDPLWDGG